MKEDEIIKNLSKLQQWAKSSYGENAESRVLMTPTVYTIIHFLFPEWDAPYVEEVWLPKKMAISY